jgi:hypothetical protein
VLGLRRERKVHALHRWDDEPTDERSDGAADGSIQRPGHYRERADIKRSLTIPGTMGAKLSQPRCRLAGIWRCMGQKLLSDRGWSGLLARLPGGLDLAGGARAAGAFVRARGVPSAAALLRLALV